MLTATLQVRSAPRILGRCPPRVPDIGLMINFSNLRRMIRPKSGSARFTIGAVVLLVLLIGLAAVLWFAWSDESTEVVKSRSDVLRNFGFLIGGVIALLFAVWRAWVAERQASASQGQVEAAQVQVEAAQRQAETAQLVLLNGRFQSGVEMLGSQLLTIRLGGIYALTRLAGEYSEEYHVECMVLLCAFVRHPTPDDTILISVAEEWGLTDPLVREDVQAAISAIGERNPDFSRLEAEYNFRVNLRGAQLVQADLREHLLVGANLEHARLMSADLDQALLMKSDISNANLNAANLSGASLSGASCLWAKLFGVTAQGTILRGANLEGTEWTGAHMQNADLTEANLIGANLQGANLDGANLSGAVFGRGRRMVGHPPNETAEESHTRLTQVQLDRGFAQHGPPPRLLDGVSDFQTGQPLVWRGRGG